METWNMESRIPNWGKPTMKKREVKVFVTKRVCLFPSRKTEWYIVIYYLLIHAKVLHVSLLWTFQLNKLQADVQQNTSCLVVCPQPLGAFIPRTLTIIYADTPKCDRKRSFVLRGMTKKEGFGWSRCVSSAGFLCQQGSWNPPKMWSENCLFRTDRKRLWKIYVFKSWSLSTKHFVVRASHVLSVLESGQHVLKSSCECRSTRTSHIRTQAFGLSRHLLAHGNTPTL